MLVAHKYDENGLAAEALELGRDLWESLNSLRQAPAMRAPQAAELLSAFRYLTHLCQDVLTRPDESTILFAQQLLELLDQLAETPTVPASTLQEFTSALEKLSQSLPPTMAALHQQNLEVLAPVETADTAKVVAFAKTPRHTWKALLACALLKAASPDSDTGVLDAELVPMPAAVAEYTVPLDLEVPAPILRAAAQAVQAQVATATAQPVAKSETTVPANHAPENSQRPPNRPPLLVITQLPDSQYYDQTLAQAEQAGTVSRLRAVINNPVTRQRLIQMRQRSDLHPAIPLMALVESDMNPEARSKSGAMGLLQDMGRLYGVYGDPDAVKKLAQNNLLPDLKHAEYRQIIGQIQSGEKLDRGTLLECLKRIRDHEPEVWTDFLAQQKALIISEETGPLLASFYLQELVTKAAKLIPASPRSADALYLGIATYNMGPGTLEDLQSVMRQQGLRDFRFPAVAQFVMAHEFPSLMLAAGQGHLVKKLREAVPYAHRTINFGHLLTTSTDLNS